MEIPNWLVQILIPIGGAIGTAIGVVITIILIRLAKKLGFDLNSKEQEFLHSAVDSAIGFVDQTFVSQIKKQSVGGALTTEEAKAAMQLTIETLKEKAVEVGSAKLKELTSDPERLAVLIESRIPIIRAKLES